MRRSLLPMLLMATASITGPTQAQPLAEVAGWRACTALADMAERLACFDRWAAQQPGAEAAPAASPSVPPEAPVALPDLGVPVPGPTGCRQANHSVLSRTWELEEATDCGTFQFRAYRPLTLAFSLADSVNAQPSSPADGHTTALPVDYRLGEMKVALSLRTKVATGLLPLQDPQAKDSLWFAYSQQSYWQVVSPQISRPFRNTDHEPELFYIYPLPAELPAGWRLRFGGLGVVHQSNGQSLPLSRSWNRTYLMAGLEHPKGWQLYARLWGRLPESRGEDDNPDISDRIGRSELKLLWDVNPRHTLALTWRHPLDQGPGGSVSLDWFRSLGGATPDGRGSLRLHTQLFSGYGDSLLDYNRRRTVLSIGLSLMDF